MKLQQPVSLLSALLDNVATSIKIFECPGHSHVPAHSYLTTGIIAARSGFRLVTKCPHEQHLSTLEPSKALNAIVSHCGTIFLKMQRTCIDNAFFLHDIRLYTCFNFANSARAFVSFALAYRLRIQNVSSSLFENYLQCRLGLLL